jgi:glycosyltransferase involved in cell wall biosynthesis
MALEQMVTSPGNNLVKPSLSVIIITKNEALDIQGCLASVAWADEIIVVDSGSTDETLAFAREYTQHVFIEPEWKGFGVQKNRALAYATSDWVLSIDADEIVSPELQQEIRAAIASTSQDIFSMPRLSSFCGKYIHHSGWWPDRIVRLFKRGKAEFSIDLVHERLLFQGIAKPLQSPLLHKTYRDLDEVIAKINQYSKLGAENAQREGKTSSLLLALLHGSWAFIRTYFLRAGFLDGAEGLMLAISNAEVTYYRYLKLHFLNNNSLRHTD